jgi:hypothetical protein
MPCALSFTGPFRYPLGLETSWDASTFPSDEIVAPLEETNDLVIDDVVKIFGKPDWAAVFMKELAHPSTPIKEHGGDKR